MLSRTFVQQLFKVMIVPIMSYNLDSGHTTNASQHRSKKQVFDFRVSWSSNRKVWYRMYDSRLIGPSFLSEALGYKGDVSMDTPVQSTRHTHCFIYKCLLSNVDCEQIRYLSIQIKDRCVCITGVDCKRKAQLRWYTNHKKRPSDIY